MQHFTAPGELVLTDTRMDLVIRSARTAFWRNIWHFIGAVALLLVLIVFHEAVASFFPEASDQSEWMSKWLPDLIFYGSGIALLLVLVQGSRLFFKFRRHFAVAQDVLENYREPKYQDMNPQYFWREHKELFVDTR